MIKLQKQQLDFLLVFKINFIMQYRGNTAVEIIYNRADHKKEHMGLTSWEGAPNSKMIFLQNMKNWEKS